jgi:phage-related protein
MRIPVAFYRTSEGNEPAREFLKSLSRGDRREIGADLHTLQSDWPIGLPLVRSLGKGLWELRSALDGRIARMFFRATDRCPARIYQEAPIDAKG